ncbi:MAG: A24 family peptidase [Thermoguttaceae bacterium]|nr:A24 family peptidase [Thermoguttaceae bacterium]MDW8079982.1 A24 family peptidase [Thermoguttaceae bacterium]
MDAAAFFWGGGWLLLGGLGLCVGALVNWAVYELAYNRRPISPWSPGRRGPVTWADRVPVWGWLRLRREESTWGKGFWIRPAGVEAAWAVALPALYWWEVVVGGVDFASQPADLATLHVRFAFHAVLFTLMTAGSLIDLDEKTLPDAITLPGTWLGLLLAALYPWALLPDLPRIPFEDRLEAILSGHLSTAEIIRDLRSDYRFLHAASPYPWPFALEGAPNGPALALGLSLWWFWCFALMDRRWHGRLGLRRAWRYFCARLVRSPASHFAFAMGLVGSLGIVIVWTVGGERWRGLLSALIGLGAGTALVWGVRLLGGWALGREAMGFGDVVLMALLGTVVGWQGVLIIFFVAPIIALGFGIVHAILRQGTVIPYGPFLCLAAGCVILSWGRLWPELTPIFRLGWVLPLVLSGCLLLLPPLLVVVRLVREVLEALLIKDIRD